MIIKEKLIYSPLLHPRIPEFNYPESNFLVKLELTNLNSMGPNYGSKFTCPK